MKIGILQRNILITAGVIFILFLIILLFNYATNEWRKPPQKCPDFWVEEEGQCYNIKGLGKCNSSNIGDYSTKNISMPNIEKEKYYYMDFEKMTGGNCNKQKWANGCGIAWDGITYGYGKTSPCN